MTKYSGRLVSIGLAREATRGVGEVADIWMPHMDASFASKITDARVSPSLGRLADSEQHHVLTKFAEGGISGQVRSQSIGYLLYALTGTHSVTGPTDTTAYTHTFTALDNSSQHDTLSITVDDPDKTVIHELAALQNLEIEIPLDDVASFNSTWMARVQQPATTATVSLTNEQKFTKRKASIKIAANIAGLAAASKLSLKRFRITFNKALIADDVLGTVWPEDFLVGNFGIEGEFELQLTDTTYRDYFLNGTNRAMEIALTSPNVVTGAATTYASLTIQLPNVDFFGWEPNRPLDDIVSQTVSFKANYDIANSQEILHSLVLVNGKATYA